jgi:hypothetical protein
MAKKAPAKPNMSAAPFAVDVSYSGLGSFLTSLAFVLALAVIIARALMSETVRDALTPTPAPTRCRPERDDGPRARRALLPSGDFDPDPPRDRRTNTCCAGRGRTLFRACCDLDGPQHLLVSDKFLPR